MTQPLSRSVSDRVEKTQNPQLPGTETSLKLIKQTERQRCPLGHTAETHSGSALTREQTCHQECVSCLPSPVLLPVNFILRQAVPTGWKTHLREAVRLRP